MRSAVTTAVPGMNALLLSPPDIGLVAVAGSTGGMLAMREILAHLPTDFPAPVVCLQHVTASQPGKLVEMLQSGTGLVVRWARQGEPLLGGVVYLCPPERCPIIEPDCTISLAPMTTLHERLNSADSFFQSVATTYGCRSVVIVLSGEGLDGRKGIAAVRTSNGVVLVQDEASAVVWGMARWAFASGCVDQVLPPQFIGPLLTGLVRNGQPLTALQASAATLMRAPRPAVGPVLKAALRQILWSALTMNGTDLGILQLVDRESGKLAIVKHRGFGLDFLEHFDAISVDDDCAYATAMRQRSCVFVSDITNDPSFVAHRTSARVAGFSALLSAPLIGRDGAVLGVLSTHFRQPRDATPEAMHSLDCHAQDAVDAIEKLQSS
jgi:hypothetical protein